MRKRKPIPEIPVAHTEDKPALVYHQVTTVEAWLKTKAEAERWLEARKAEGFTIKQTLCNWTRKWYAKAEKHEWPEVEK